MSLDGTLQGGNVISPQDALIKQLFELRQRQQQELAQNSQAAQAASQQAQQQYTQAAAAPPPNLGGMDLLIPTLLSGVASVLTQNEGPRQRGQEFIKNQQEGLNQQRYQNLQALRDVAHQKAQLAEKAGDLELQHKSLAEVEKINKQLEALGLKQQNAIALENLKQSHALARIEAQGAQARQTKEVEPGKAPRPIPASHLERMTLEHGMIGQLGDIRKQFKPEFVGPVNALLGAGRVATGIGRKEGEAKFRSNAQSYFDRVTKLLSGAQTSAQEIARMKGEVPRVSDPPETFQEKMDQTEENLRYVAQLRRDNLESQGYDVSKLPAIPEKGAGTEPVNKDPLGIR